MSGTGRRRKPPAGEEGGGEQYQPPAYEQQYQQPQYQTYAPAAEPEYDYDWRQPAPGASAAQPVIPSPAPSPATPPSVPQQPQYERYDSYNQYDQYSAQREDYAFPPTPAPAPAPSFARPEARPEPQVASRDEFDFDFDLDEPPGAAASAAPSAPPASSSTRTADKDGYRPDDFDFVDESDDPDLGSWLSFSESRADSRAERARRMRIRLIAAGVLVALVGAGVGIYAWLGGSVPGLSGQDQATKSMILFRLDDAKGDSVGDALMVTNRGGSTDGSAGGTGAIVVIPAQMQIDDQGFGAQPFGGNMASNQPPAGSEEVASALGVTPDGTWTMDETTFGILVDELEDISVTTNTAIPATSADPKGVKAGAVTLDGAQAVAYATYQASGEAASVQAARFGQVLEAVMAKMPTYSNAVTANLNQLGLIPDPALPLSKLSPILAALAAQEAAGKVTVAALPLSADGSDTLNAAGAAQIVDKLLGGTVKAGASAGQSARVLVQNATGVSGQAAAKLIAAAQAKLVDAGYTYNAGSSAAAQEHTVVEVASSSGQSLAQQVAAALGLSGSAVQVVSGLSSVDDVTVVLGKDWSSLSAQ